jgi:hypothetical protein
MLLSLGKLSENSERFEKTPQKSLRQVGKPSKNCQEIPEIKAILDSSV